MPLRTTCCCVAAGSAPAGQPHQRAGHRVQLNEWLELRGTTLVKRHACIEGQQAPETHAGGHGEVAHPTSPPSLTGWAWHRTRKVLPATPHMSITQALHESMKLQHTLPYCRLISSMYPLRETRWLLEPCLLVRRRVAFQWFFTEFSVRPGSCLAMSAHLQGKVSPYLHVPREERAAVPGGAVQMHASQKRP